MSHTHSHSHAHETEGKLSPFLAKQRYKKSAAFIKSKDVVLDLGCGVGGFRKFLPKSTKYYGVDIEANWEGNPDYLFRGSIGKKLPKELKNKDFTVVTALAIIEHLDKPVNLFKDASMVLDKGGKVILTTPHPLGRKVHDNGAKLGLFSNHASDEHEDFLDKETLAETAKAGGFKMVSYKRFLFGMNQVAVFVKK